MRSTEEKIKRKVISVVIIVAILSTMTGCGKSQSRKEPITLTIWHVYGGQTDSPLNDLIDEFNGTEGKKEGIKIQVGMVSNTNTIHEEVLKAANKDPGAAKLPDLFISWEPYARAAIEGGIWLNEGYATEPLRTGESIVSVASSASVLYYEDIVTYSDNRSEPIEIIARPVPVFKNGGKLVMQRGAGICLTKSDPEREEAAAKFVKWLTEPEKNVQFVTSVGYMPVTEKAFELLPEAINNLTNEKYKSLYQAFIDTQNEYTFYCAPQMDSYLDSEMKFEKNIRMKLTSARKRYMNNEADIETLVWDTFQEFSDSME